MTKATHMWNPVRMDHRIGTTKPIGKNDMLVYADPSARDSGLPSPVNGMVCGLEDHGALAHYLNSRWMGGLPVAFPSGDTSGATDYADIQGALTDHGRVFLMPGHYDFDTGLATDGQDVDIRGYGVTLDFSSATSFTNNACIYLDAGDQTSVATQSGNETAGNYEWTFASAHGLAAGDVIAVEDTTESSYSSARAYYYKKERFVVTLVPSDTTIETDRGAYFDWAAADATWTKLPGYTASIEGTIEIIGKNDAACHECLDLYNMVFPRISGLRLRGSTDAVLELGECYGGVVDSVWAMKGLTDGGTGTSYGIVVMSCENIVISNCTLYGARHAVAVGGNGLSMNVHVVRSTLSSVDSYAADFHGNTVRSSYDHCTIYNGMSVGGNDNSVTNCDIDRGQQTLSIYVTEEMSGWSWRFSGNYYRNITAGNDGLYAVADDVCQYDGAFVVSNETFDVPFAADAGTLVEINTKAGDASGPTGSLTCEINGLHANGPGSTSNNSSIILSWDQGSTPEHVSIKDLYVPGRVLAQYFKDIDVRNVFVEASSGHGIELKRISGSLTVQDVIVKSCGSTDMAMYVTGDDATLLKIKDFSVLSACDYGMFVHKLPAATESFAVVTIAGVTLTTEPTTYILSLLDNGDASIADIEFTDTSKVQITNAPRLDVWGAGTPESNLIGHIGSTFRRTDGGADTTLYAKESGTGNTGWEAVQTTGT